MKFQVGDIVYWEHYPSAHWKILEMSDINHAKIELIKSGDYNYTGSKIGTKLVWHLTTALLVERGEYKKRSHPLTNIFKD